MSRVQTLEPAHTDACPSDCSQDAQAIVVVQTVDGRVLGTFSTHELAYSFALTSGQLCTLIPQVLDTPEWGNVRTH